MHEKPASNKFYIHTQNNLSTCKKNLTTFLNSRNSSSSTISYQFTHTYCSLALLLLLDSSPQPS